MNAPLDLYLFHFQAEDRQQNLTYFMRADGTREGKCLETKGGFFSESVIRFSDLQISTILSLKFNFKLRIVFWNIFLLKI